MSIKESAIELIEIVNKLCKEKDLDIKDIIDKKNEFNTIWKEAGKRFDYINNHVNNDCSCKKCKRYETNIKDIEVICNRKKADWEGKGNLMKDGVVIGLEMALTMLK